MFVNTDVRVSIKFNGCKLQIGLNVLILCVQINEIYDELLNLLWS